MISCPNCGGNPRFDIASQMLLCPNCGSKFDVASFPEEQSGADAQTVSGDQAGQPDKMQVTIYTCSQCGGELMSTDTDATAFCSYCGSHQVLEERLSVQDRPKRIIPFKITKEDCKKAYASKLKRSLFAPKELHDTSYIDEFRGIYMPYWSYDFTQNGNISFKGTTEHRSGDYRIVDYYALSVDADNAFRGISHDASTSFDDKISESLAPYDSRQAVPFSTSYLSGFYADISDVQDSTYMRESAAIAARAFSDEVRDIPEFKKYDMEEPDDASIVDKTKTRLESASTAMFPVWFLSFRKDDRVAYAAINGQTGKMTADIPIDHVRYLIGTGLVAAVIWIILQFVNISSLRGTTLTVVFGAMAGALVYGMILHRLDSENKNREWENYMRERALMKANEQESGDMDKKKRGKKKSPKPPEKDHSAIGIVGTAVFWLILVAAACVAMLVGYSWLIIAEPVIVAFYVSLGFSDATGERGKLSNWVLCAVTALGVVIWAVKPYEDIIYYGCCVLMMICVVWCFFDALYYYNQLMTRPLPQFNKQGGDDRA
ncbi:MAG: hypothetical protein K5696_11230 [Lachnospiraceae bacterium]|nr:hypothetical protein [Lachnospiraceae bacterium]